MPYVALEDVGTTQRRSLSGRRRLQAWERTGGTCVVCGLIIDGVRERWIVEHIRALELGGVDELENMGPAHESCGREKTRDDHALTARAKRQKIRHLGAAVSARPLPGSRSCLLKRKLNGSVIPRHTSVSHRSHRQPSIEPPDIMAVQSGIPPVDDVFKTVDRLCNHDPESIKENETGTGHLMTNRARPPRTRETVGAGEAPATGDILLAIPRHLDFLFEDRPLLPDENADQYDALLRSIFHQVHPADVIEAIWVKEITDLIWEAKRLRRWRGQILVQARLKAVANLILPHFQNDPSGLDTSIAVSIDALAAGWVIGSKSEKREVDDILRVRGLTAADVMAHSFLLNLPAIERIDRLAFSADQRRDMLLREIERKRTSFAQQLRATTGDILDAEPE